jgi:hypothetical protein
VIGDRISVAWPNNDVYLGTVTGAAPQYNRELHQLASADKESIATALPMELIVLDQFVSMMAIFLICRCQWKERCLWEEK